MHFIKFKKYTLTYGKLDHMSAIWVSNCDGIFLFFYQYLSYSFSAFFCPALQLINLFYILQSYIISNSKPTYHFPITNYLPILIRNSIQTEKIYIYNLHCFRKIQDKHIKVSIQLLVVSRLPSSPLNGANLPRRTKPLHNTIVLTWSISLNNCKWTSIYWQRRAILD